MGLSRVRGLLSTRRRPAPPERRHAEDGFSILEVALSLLIFLTVLVAVSSLLVTADKVGTNSRLKAEAVGIATSALDTQIESGATTLLSEIGDASLGTQTPTAGPGTFTLEREVAPYVPGSSSCVSPASNSEAVLKVTVWVTWAHVVAGSQWWVAGAAGSTGEMVSSSSLVSLPAAAFNASDGAMLVQVTGASGEAESGVTVTATSNGASLPSVSTTTSGCAVFSNVTPGTWTVSVSRSGWIDSQNDVNASTDSPQAPSQTQVVTAGSTTTFSFSYAPAATVTVQYSVDGGTPPAGLDLPLSFYNASLNTDPTVMTGSPSSLYPWASAPSYYVVAGSCGSESDPDTATPPGSVDGQPVTMSEGGSTTLTIPLTPVQVEVTDNGAPVSGASVSAAVPSGDTSCPSPGSSTAMPAMNLGITGAVLTSDVSEPPHHGALTVARSRRPAHPAVLTSFGGSSCQANVALSVSPDPSTSGQSVSLTAVVTNAGSPYYCWYFSGVPTGTVRFADGSATLGTVSLDGSGTTTFTTSRLSIGNHSITASYSGDSRYQSATSAAVTQVVSNGGGTTTTTVPSTTTTVAPTTTVPATTTTLAPGTVGVSSGLPYGRFVLSASYTSGGTTLSSKTPPTVVITAGGVYVNGSATPLAPGSVLMVAVS